MGSFEQGHKKVGGRKAGTPNKTSAYVAELLDLVGLNPIVEMAKLAQSESGDPYLRFAALKELAQYLYPKRKAIDPNEVQLREVQAQEERENNKWRVALESALKELNKEQEVET